jgi:hypothetical protein
MDRQFNEAKQRTVYEGLALTPAERLQLAEDLWQEFAQGRKTAKPWAATFNTFEEARQAVWHISC